MERKSVLKIVGIVALVFLVGAVSFSLYTAPKQTNKILSNTATYFCASDARIQATFATSSVALTLSDGRSMTLLQSRSASGARYEATTTGSDIVFWNKGDNAFVTENDKTTYENCTAAQVTSSDAPGYQTYTDQSGSFTFALPTDFSIAGSAIGYTQDWSVDATMSGMVLAHIEVPKSYELGTNFGDARFIVGTSADPSAVATCLTNPDGNFGNSTPVTINGVSFTKIAFTGAGAGNRYDTTSYRVVRDSQCYAVEYTIHYSVFENYPVGAIKKFDEARVQTALEELVQSFQFLH